MMIFVVWLLATRWQRISLSPKMATRWQSHQRNTTPQTPTQNVVPFLSARVLQFLNRVNKRSRFAICSWKVFMVRSRTMEYHVVPDFVVHCSRFSERFFLRVEY